MMSIFIIYLYFTLQIGSFIAENINGVRFLFQIDVSILAFEFIVPYLKVVSLEREERFHVIASFVANRYDVSLWWLWGWRLIELLVLVL